MGRFSGKRLSPAMVVAIVALVFAVVGTAVAGVATVSVLSKKEKKQTRNIAKDEIKKAAPGLAVASAKNADAVDGVSEEALTLGRSGNDLICDPTSTTFLGCTEADLSMPRAGRVLVIGTGGQVSTTTPGAGDCRIEVDGAPVGAAPTIEPGEAATINTSNEAENGFAITQVTPPLGAGAHAFVLACNETAANTRIFDATISAVMIGSG